MFVFEERMRAVMPIIRKDRVEKERTVTKHYHDLFKLKTVTI